MSKLLILLMLLADGVASEMQLKLEQGSSGPKYTISPIFAPEPATVAFLLLNIPEESRVACFVLDGPNYYASCREVDGRKSYRLEYKGVLAGHYFATIILDKQQLPTTEIIITESGAPNG